MGREPSIEKRPHTEVRREDLPPMGPATSSPCTCASNPELTNWHLPSCPLAGPCDLPAAFARNEDVCGCGLPISEHTADHRDPPVRETARTVDEIIERADGHPILLAVTIDRLMRAAELFEQTFGGSADPGVQKLLRLVEEVNRFDHVTIDEEGWVVARQAQRHDAGATDLYASYVLDEDETDA